MTPPWGSLPGEPKSVGCAPRDADRLMIRHMTIVLFVLLDEYTRAHADPDPMQRAADVLDRMRLLVLESHKAADRHISESGDVLAELIRQTLIAGRLDDGRHKS